MNQLLALLPDPHQGRARRDRLELLSAQIDAPSFDPIYRPDVIEMPRQHPVFGWLCQVADCDGVGRGDGLCVGHYEQWQQIKTSGATRVEFVATAAPISRVHGSDLGCCRICPARPAKKRDPRLCERHFNRWRLHHRDHPVTGFGTWLAGQQPLPGYGPCLAATCPHLATSPLGLCGPHGSRYRNDSKPGGARLPADWGRLETAGHLVPVTVEDEVAFRRWCTAQQPILRHGTVNLAGLQPLVKAEIKWGMFCHAQTPNPTRWACNSLQRVAIVCRADKVSSLFDLAAGAETPRVRDYVNAAVRMIIGEIAAGLRLVYYSPHDTRAAGFIETDHFGRRFTQSRSHFDLTGVTQRWLRDLLWDYMAASLESPRCPRRRGTFDNLRRGAVELSAFLETDAPGGGHDPTLLEAEHAQRFVADQRHRARHGLPSLGLHRVDGKPSTVTETTRRFVFNYVRSVTYRALETGAADHLGLSREFITAIPWGGTDRKRSRSPFSDAMARALADETNLQRLATVHDPADRGIRDIWEAIVYTGRRCSEVTQLRLDCIARHRGLPMLWHDQTKVDHYNEAIRIPEALYQRLDARRATTLDRFVDRHGRSPTTGERAAMALFPSPIRNLHGDRALSYGLFQQRFQAWVVELDVGSAVAHQARHTMATNLLRAGASLTHIRRYLGHVSDRMAEHYTHVAHSDLEDVLHAVWVSGPGSAVPGQLLSANAEPLTREEATTLALDLSRRSTPAEGGFCTFQPVVDGGACPWSLDCENCDKFVLSGGDLLYWRRKQQQWRSLAERAPDEATADYLHQVFEPTARAIEGLEKALAGLGLLEEALALDLRRPQDYFQRLWSTGFRAADLVATTQPTMTPSAEETA